MWKCPRSPNVEVGRVDLPNWAFRTSPKFTTVVKYKFRQGSWPDISGNPNHPSPHFSNPYIASPTSHNSTILPSLRLRHISLYNPSVASPTSQLILQPFPSLHLRHSSFYNPSVASPTSYLIVKSSRCFTYVTTHSPTLPSLYLHRSLFSNPSVALPTSQFILQPSFRFSFTGSSLTSPGEPSMRCGLVLNEQGMLNDKKNLNLMGSTQS